MNRLLAAATLSFAVAAAGAAQAARDYVWAAGSSTVFPYTTRVAETFARKTGARTPKVESLGTGGGIKLFCGGAGDAFPDIANASRPMKASEYDACVKNGVTDIIELRIGYDGIVLAMDKRAADLNIKLEHLYLALSDEVLRQGRFQENPYGLWSQIGAGLPPIKILVYGPPPTSGTRDAFLELGIEAGAQRLPPLKALKGEDEKAFKAKVDPLRNDRWIDAGENDNAIVQTLTRTPGSAGVFGYFFYEENRDKVKVASIDGVKPSFETIASGKYPLSRSLYIYVKASRLDLTPGLRAFVREYCSDAASGRGGYLQERGMIPLPPALHEQVKAQVKAGKLMSRPAK
ncbi:MAG TPA: substrate-binding domain-containing protein [Caulobacter sp.]|nr:substrate-binding domain-containing protein [Caulobacter sp.]